jgi:hypothetical protein
MWRKKHPSVGIKFFFFLGTIKYYLFFCQKKNYNYFKKIKNNFFLPKKKLIDAAAVHLYPIAAHSTLSLRMSKRNNRYSLFSQSVTSLLPSSLLLIFKTAISVFDFAQNFPTLKLQL